MKNHQKLWKIISKNHSKSSLVNFHLETLSELNKHYIMKLFFEFFVDLILTIRFLAKQSQYLFFF